jgi:hypothetical protein
MGPPQNPISPREKQAAGGRKRPLRGPRRWLCLLKGCERRFQPRHARQRYCSEECRKAARQWSEWKAGRRWRATAAGKPRRNGQSRRYRERLKERKPAEKTAVPRPARVITKKFFRGRLRPAGLLRVLRALAAIATATVLLAGLPARDGARLGTRTALAKRVRLASPSAAKTPAGAAALGAAEALEMSLTY